MIVRLCSSAIDPEDVLILSSKGDRYYSVTPASLFNDPVCECAGYMHRGECRHIKQVAQMQCRWSDIKDEKCPNCGGEVVEFELEPVRETPNVN